MSFMLFMYSIFTCVNCFVYTFLVAFLFFLFFLVFVLNSPLGIKLITNSLLLLFILGCFHDLFSTLIYFSYNITFSGLLECVLWAGTNRSTTHVVYENSGGEGGANRVN